MDAPAATLDRIPLLLCASDAAAYTGLTRTRLFELQRSGDLRGVMVGGRRYWVREHLDAFVAGLTPTS